MTYIPRVSCNADISEIDDAERRRARFNFVKNPAINSTDIYIRETYRSFCLIDLWYVDVRACVDVFFVACSNKLTAFGRSRAISGDEWREGRRPLKTNKARSRSPRAHNKPVVPHGKRNSSKRRTPLTSRAALCPALNFTLYRFPFDFHHLSSPSIESEDRGKA